MAHQFLGQVLAGIIISGILLVGPSVIVFNGWSEWHSKIYKGEFSVWQRVTASVGILSVTAQTILFIALLITIFGTFRNEVLVAHRFFLTDSVLVELVLLILAAPCTFAWRGRVKWWLLASSFYLPVISFFSVLAVLAY
jgi:hypothetical protein